MGSCWEGFKAPLGFKTFVNDKVFMFCEGSFAWGSENIIFLSGPMPRKLKVSIFTCDPVPWKLKVLIFARDPVNWKLNVSIFA